jgi:hypothetical protein
MKSAKKAVVFLYSALWPFLLIGSIFALGDPNVSSLLDVVRKVFFILNVLYAFLIAGWVIFIKSGIFIFSDKWVLRVFFYYAFACLFIFIYMILS